MTPKEFKKAMVEIKKTIYEKDLEVSHDRADELLCRALFEAGYGEGVSIYDSMEKWYA